MTESRSGPVFIAVGGGKGGVGKSFVTASLALSLARDGARTGARVAAVDLDLGGSNLNLFLGEPHPERELADFVDGRVETLGEVLQPTRLPNLRYVAGSFDMVTALDPLRERKLDLIRALVGLDADFVLLDLQAGATPVTLDFYFLGDVKLLVTNPEATAFHNAYGFLKNYVLRRILTELRDRREALHFVLEYYRGTSEEPVPDRTITALVAELRERFPEVEPEVEGILEYDAPLLLLNRVRDRDERQYLDRFRAVVEQNLALRCPELGTIPEDKRVGRATRDGRPFVLAHPRHPIARRFSEWATRLTRARS
jgi:flagellar biosynthesis protein FlhG